MKKNESITKVMSRDITTVHLGQKVSDARKLLAQNRFHHLPVVSGKQLLGLISASDILGLSVEGLGSDDRAMDAYLDHQFSIETVMNRELNTLGVNSTVAQAAEVLSDGSFHAVPVLDSEGFLAGLVTSTDLIRYLHEQF